MKALIRICNTLTSKALGSETADVSWQLCRAPNPAQK